MKSRIAIASLIACFALTATVNAGAILVVDTNDGTMEFHFGNTATFPDVGVLDPAHTTATTAGGLSNTTGFAIESAGGGLAPGANLFGLLYATGGVLSNTTENYTENAPAAGGGVSFSDPTVAALAADVFGNAGVRYNTTLDTRDLVVPFPGAGFAGVAYIGDPIPEPTSLVTMLLGCIGMVMASRRSR